MSVTGFSRYRDTSAVIPNLGGTTEQCFALSKFNASGFFYARNSGGYAMKLDKLVGDQDFDMEDFDKEGFGGLDEAGNSFEEEKY